MENLVKNYKNMYTTSSEPRRVTKSDGTVMHLWEGKLHNWSGPAQINPDGTKEYYIHGIKLNEKDYKKRTKEREGLPWFKSPGMKGKIRF